MGQLHGAIAYFELRTAGQCGLKANRNRCLIAVGLYKPMNFNSQLFSSRFFLEGRFAGFSPQKKKNPFKYLRLVTAEGEYCIKLPKYLQIEVVAHFTPGHWVQISGTRKEKSDGTLQLKADAIIHANPSSQTVPHSTCEASAAESAQAESALPSVAPCPAKTSKILICRNSGCTQRGGQAVYEQIIALLHDLGLTDQVTLKPTQCMGCCKAGPNLIFMPDQARYSRVRPDAVSDLVRYHL